MKRAAFALFGLSFLAACGSSNPNPIVAVPIPAGEFPRIGVAEPMHYRFLNSEGDPTCDTGTHTFNGDTQPEVLGLYCRALLDDERNHNCAARQRYDEARLKCPSAE